MSETFTARLVANTVGASVIWFEEEPYLYRIVDPKLEPRLPGFVGFLTNPDSLFISADVPCEDRRPVLIHEILCNQLLARRPGRCARALREELDHVTPGRRDRYITSRLAFFRALVAYHETSPDSGFRRDLAESLVLLEDLH